MSLDPVLLASFSATEARERLVAGDCSVRDYARALLARVDAIESQVQAWAHLDRAHVLAQAGAADEARARGETDGPLFGLPVGVKDVIDTADLPTEHGTVLHAGRMPRDDAAVVRRLRAAGGWVMGKTVTTELATYAPGKTRNPHVPVSGSVHTPGGSSSGSAAAVAAGMVPLAIGTQTNGSVIRPASFCGVYGFKPSAGLIPRTGVLTQSPAFDAIGVFGRTLDDVALLAQTLTGHDPQDPLTQLRAAPPWLRLAAADAPVPPRLGWVATPFWSRVQPDAQTAFGELLASLEGRVTSFELPASAAEAVGWHRAVMEADIAGSFELEYERGRDRLSASLRGQIERGRQVTAVDYRKALARVPVLLESLDSLFDGCDALLTPATLGTAPAGLESTGDPLMCTLWTYLGMPALSLPLLQGANGLPLGVQLVGRRGDDARLLRTARWLVRTASPNSA
ncbi:MAG: amidase [Betaproteobacteria bacterium]|nr:amidase [Betaproteobacteria bacterium]